jgi:mycothiol synthase
VLQLLAVCHAAGYVDMELHSIGLRSTFRQPAFDPAAQSRLIEFDGCLAAFGILWNRRYLGMLVHPEWRGRLEAQLIDWAEARASTDAAWVLTRSDDIVTRGVLDQRGWAVVDDELRMGRMLTSPIPPASLPAGFAFRSLDAEQEIDAWCALYTEAFGPRLSAIDKWRALRFDPDYLPDLDLVVVAPDGRLAAACTCTISRHEQEFAQIKEGRTEPVMVASQYQRRGLGRACVLEGLRRLRAYGMDIALLTTETDNVAAHRLYESLGYAHPYSALWYAARDDA